MRVWQGQMMHDIDEPGDLVHLPATFLMVDLDVTNGAVRPTKSNEKNVSSQP
jgi:hypothetical protein